MRMRVACTVEKRNDALKKSAIRVQRHPVSSSEKRAAVNGVLLFRRDGVKVRILKALLCLSYKALRAEWDGFIEYRLGKTFHRHDENC